MSSITEKLAAKKAAPETTPTSEIKTGMQSSVEVAPPPATPTPPDEEPDSSVNLADVYKDYPENSYLMKRQKVLILKNGTLAKPDRQGIITGDTEEKKDLLEYLDKQNRNLVIKVK